MPINNLFLYFRCFPPSYLTSLQVDKTIFKIPSKTPFLYTSTFLQFFSCSYSHPYSFHRKSFPLLQPFSQLRLFQLPKQRGSLVKSETVVISPCFSKVLAVITTRNAHSHWFHIAQTHKIGKGLFQLVVSVEDACNRNDKAPTPPLTLSIYYHDFNILLIRSEELICLLETSCPTTTIFIPSFLISYSSFFRPNISKYSLPAIEFGAPTN